MELDPILRDYIASRANEPRFSALEPQAARASRANSRMKTWPGAAQTTAEDITVPMAWGSCRARFYRPLGEMPAALVVFFHGGGFVVCDINTHDGVARSIAGGAGIAVLSVDYRLAPEHPWPAGQEDAIAAIEWACENAPALGIDPTQIILCGDSAGGNLAAVAARRLAGHIPLLGLALFYPTVDYPDAGHGSYREFSEGFGLTEADSAYFWQHYLSGHATRPAEPAILRAADLSGLPPTFVGTAEYDVLRDEGEAFAARLMAAGVTVTGRRYLGANHNFIAFAGQLQAANSAYADVCRWIREQISKQEQ
jgi:acetyl esterase